MVFCAEGGRMFTMNECKRPLWRACTAHNTRTLGAAREGRRGDGNNVASSEENCGGAGYCPRVRRRALHVTTCVSGDLVLVLGLARRPGVPGNQPSLFLAATPEDVG
jgi:hypothetical protein